MATVKDRAFFRRLTITLGRIAITKARPKIPSRTLRRALLVVRVTDQRVRMHIPHYWARYVHDGRNAKRFTGKKFMAWYRNPKDDPRLRAFGGQTPARASQLKGLKDVISEDQFKADKRAGKIIFSQVVSQRTGVPFFANEAGGGMHGFVDDANSVGTPLTRKHILDSIGKENLNEKDVAVVKLLVF